MKTHLQFLVLVKILFVLLKFNNALKSIKNKDVNIGSLEGSELEKIALSPSAILSTTYSNNKKLEKENIDLLSGNADLLDINAVSNLTEPRNLSIGEKKLKNDEPLVADAFDTIDLDVLRNNLEENYSNNSVNNVESKLIEKNLNKKKSKNDKKNIIKQKSKNKNISKNNISTVNEKTEFERKNTSKNEKNKDDDQGNTSNLRDKNTKMKPKPEDLDILNEKNKIKIDSEKISNKIDTLNERSKKSNDNDDQEDLKNENENIDENNNNSNNLNDILSVENERKKILAKKRKKENDLKMKNLKNTIEPVIDNKIRVSPKKQPSDILNKKSEKDDDIFDEINVSPNLKTSMLKSIPKKKRTIQENSNIDYMGDDLSQLHNPVKLMRLKNHPDDYRYSYYLPDSVKDFSEVSKDNVVLLKEPYDNNLNEHFVISDRLNYTSPDLRIKDLGHVHDYDYNHLAIPIKNKHHGYHHYNNRHRVHHPRELNIKHDLDVINHEPELNSETISVPQTVINVMNPGIIQ